MAKPVKRTRWQIIAVVLAGGFLRAKDAPDPVFEAGQTFMEQGIREGRALSVALAVVKDDRVVWAAGFGLADVEANRPAGPDSVYVAEADGYFALSHWVSLQREPEP